MRTTDYGLSHLMLRDPGELLRELLPRYELDTGDLLVVAVRHPSTDQEMIGALRVPRDLWEDMERHERSDLLCRLANSLPIPPRAPRGPTECVLLTVVPRSGIAVVDSHDAEVYTAWRYSNHLTDALDTTLLLVTEHGWFDSMANRGGAEPLWDGTSASKPGRVVPLGKRGARQLRA